MPFRVEIRRFVDDVGQQAAAGNGEDRNAGDHPGEREQFPEGFQ